MAINPLTLIGQADPFREYARALVEEPVSRFEAMPGMGFTSVTRYDDCVAILRDPERFSSDGASYGPALFQRASFGEGEVPRSMLVQDPPTHTRLRGLVSRAFTPRLVAQLEPRIRAITTDLLDQVQHTGRIDVVDDLAYPLPVIVIAEILGVPAEDRDDFKRWSDMLVAALGGGLMPSRVTEQAQAAREEFIAYFTRVFEQRRAEIAAGTTREDLVTNLLRLEQTEDALTPGELLAMCILLLVAGNETTTNLIANAILALDARPDLRDRLVADPSLIPGAIEEVLRCYGPVQATIRFPKADTEFRGTTLPARQPVIVWLAAANRDPAQFPDPDTFDITREPNRHLSFGLGVHFCLGAPLARLEAKVALEELLARLPNLRRDAAEPLPRIPSFIFYGVKSLPMAFDAAVPAPARGVLTRTSAEC
jgi:cytochrome P450